MEYIVTSDARSFEYWSGAKDRINSVWELETEDRDTVFGIIEDYADNMTVCGEYPTETDINDFVWFTLDEILREEYFEIWGKLYPSDYRAELERKFADFVTPAAAAVVADVCPEYAATVADEFNRGVIFGAYACFQQITESELADWLAEYGYTESEFLESGGELIRDASFDGVVMICD